MNIFEKIEKYSIENVKELNGKKVLLRIDVNVSLGENGVVDVGEDWRILKSLKTIEFLTDAGASVVLLSHIGRDPEQSLKPIFEYMNQIFTVGFLPRYDTDILHRTISGMGQGSVLMLENVRQFSGEKENDASYLVDLVDNCDIYINDAFSVSHRKHASVNAIVKELPSYFGLQFIDEVKHLSEFMLHREGMKTLVLGGAKFGTKFTLLEKMLPDLDYVLLGGALANVFLKARGFKIGKSFCDDIDISSMVNSDKIILPLDYIDEHGDLADIQDVSDDTIILDIGMGTSKLFETIISHSSAVMWNGPMGKYEDGYSEGSIDIAKSISHSEVFSVTGGGDTSTVILENNLEDSFSFISTGGGAMLDFLVDGTLSGIDELLESKKEDN
ncbi:MAG: phosphoglycerate kinase [Candidatus Pacebacteria bacterium]|nr:phosphoglycerate kinase [Candidatus Paceibacterota bacterium]